MITSQEINNTFDYLNNLKFFNFFKFKKFEIFLQEFAIKKTEAKNFAKMLNFKNELLRNVKRSRIALIIYNIFHIIFQSMIIAIIILRYSDNIGSLIPIPCVLIIICSIGCPAFYFQNIKALNVYMILMYLIWIIHLVLYIVYIVNHKDSVIRELLTSIILSTWMLISEMSQGIYAEVFIGNLKALNKMNQVTLPTVQYNSQSDAFGVNSDPTSSTNPISGSSINFSSLFGQTQVSSNELVGSHQQNNEKHDNKNLE